jgi:hypothetical protein
MRLIPFVALGCFGCALVGQDPQRQASLVDAYLVAHGMATGYAESPGAKHAVVDELARLDTKAFLALRASDSDATEQAVAALTAFAARQ